MWDAMLVWLLPARPVSAQEPTVLVGASHFPDLLAAAPDLFHDLHKAWADGSRHREYPSPQGCYSCTVYAAEAPLAQAGDRVVVTTLCAAAPTRGGGGASGTLDSLLHCAPAAIAELHLCDGQLTYASTNRAFNALVGTDDLRGKVLGSLFERRDTTDDGVKEKLVEVARTGQRLELRQAAVRLDWQHDGHVFAKYFDVVCEPLREGDKDTVGVSVFAYDVSDQVAARREAERKEAYFRNLADSLPQIVWTADHTGAIDWLNARWYAFCGKPESDPDAKDSASQLHPDERDSTAAHWQEAIAQRTPFSQEMRLRDGMGHYRWFLVQVRPIVDEQTQEVRWFGSSTDVHEQKVSAQAMADLLDNMSDGFFVMDGDWIIRHTNKQHLLLTGIPKEQQIGRSMQDVFFPNPKDRDSPYLRHCRRAIKERICITFDEYYAPLDMWTAVSLYPTGERGLAIIYRNLSAERALQKNIEIEKQKFEAVFFDSPASMALLRGPDLIFEKVNARYRAVLGNRPLLGKTLSEAVPELENQPFRQLMRDVYETGIPFVARAMPADLTDPKTGEAHRSYFDFTYSRILDGAGRPYGVYLHATDITDKVMASRRADELAVSLTEAIEARDEFLSSASHELKTPVTSIKMQLQMTRRHVKPDEGRVPDAAKLAKTLDICGKQVDRLAALIEDLLDVSRIAAGKMTFSYAPANLSDMVSDIANQFAEQFAAAHCDLHLGIGTPITIACDAFRIEQVVVNLITNAIKYGPGSRIDLRVEPGPGGGARIEVTDRGMGISAEKQAKIFERFERAVSHDNVAGLGLGLFICKQIVQAHRGTIAVASTLGQGSVFTVELPADPRA